MNVMSEILAQDPGITAGDQILFEHFLSLAQNKQMYLKDSGEQHTLRIKLPR